MGTLYENYTTNNDNSTDVTNTTYWRGQTFTPSTSHTVDYVRILCLRAGSGALPGTVTANIKAVDGSGLPTGSVLATGNFNGNTITTLAAGEWKEVSLGAGTALTASTKYAVIWSASAADANNIFRVHTDATSPTYSGGSWVWSNGSGDPGTWTANTSTDVMFEEWSGAPSVGVVTTQSVTAISGTTATGNGNITTLNGATQHGHCWKVFVSMASPPTTADSLTTNGVPGATGAFTSAITGLTAGTKYGVRAYVTNSQGTAYGSQVVFWANKGTVAPFDAITRVNSYTRSFWAGKDGQAVYQMVIQTGGVSSTFIPAVGQRQPVSAVPQPETPQHKAYTTQDYAAALGLTYPTYVLWVNNMGPINLLKVYGHVPTFEEYVQIMATQFKAGAK